MLTPEQKQALRLRLLAINEELQNSLAAAAESSATVELDQTRQGRLSRMDALQGQAMAQASHARATARLHSIQQTLKRLNDADYGDCMECGEAIAFERLQIDPSLRLCITCAEAGEI